MVVMAGKKRNYQDDRGQKILVKESFLSFFFP